jgi:hypothetical protein
MPNMWKISWQWGLLYKVLLCHVCNVW